MCPAPPFPQILGYVQREGLSDDKLNQLK
jgi:hypothetical protein